MRSVRYVHRVFDRNVDQGQSPATSRRFSCELMRLRGLLALGVVVAGLVSAVTNAPASEAVRAEFSYAALDTVLARHVHDGRVDYGALARDRGPLARFLAATREARPESWSRHDQLAFWINVYNARVLDGVVRRPGLKSVLDVGKKLGMPTLGFFHEKGMSAGRELSLNDIEHDIVSRDFHEPRAHFALNCASASCPQLPAQALDGVTLDSALTAAAREFLSDRSKNPETSGDVLRLSSIFKWYRGDFEGAAGSLPAFIARYRSPGRALPARVAVRFVDYDWSLNGHW